MKGRLNPLFHWKGKYKTWNDAKAGSFGYDNKSILDKVSAATLEAIGHEGWYEKDGTVFREARTNGLLVSSLLYAGLDNKKLNVLDFGGALGSIYTQHKKLLKKLDIKWNVIEQSGFVESGKKIYPKNEIGFYNSIEEYNETNTAPDVVILSSVLQYLETPYEILGALINLKPKYVIADLTVFSPEISADILTVQHIAKEYYGKKMSYPCWIFSEKKLRDTMEKGFHLLIGEKAYTGAINFESKTYHYSFFLFEKKEMN
ncbi:MAG: methyltransferase, TIGR04325 family [Bacteroidia bacterium]